MSVAIKKRVLRSTRRTVTTKKSCTVELDTDVMLVIISYLDVESLLRCKEVCRVWKTWVSHDCVWRQNVYRFRKRYGVPGDYFKIFQRRLEFSFRDLVLMKEPKMRAWMAIPILMMTLPYLSIENVSAEAHCICGSVYLVALFSKEFSKSFHGIEKIYPRIHPLSGGEMEVTFEFDENDVLPCCAYTVVIRNWSSVFLKGDTAVVAPSDDAETAELQLFKDILNSAVDMRQRLTTLVRE